MGIFSNLFNNKEKENHKEEQLPWVSLNNQQQLTNILDNSNTKPQFIFKHSTTCGISRMVISMFTNNYSIAKEAADLYYLDLHAHRQLSNQVATAFNVVHQSPQLLVIRNKAVVFHASHGAIAEVDLERFL